VAWYFTDQHLFAVQLLGDFLSQQLLSSGTRLLCQSLHPAAVGNLTNGLLGADLTVQVSEQTFSRTTSARPAWCSASKQSSPDRIRIPALPAQTAAIAKDLASQCRVFCEPWQADSDSSTLSTLFNWPIDLNNKVASCGLWFQRNVGAAAPPRQVQRPAAELLTYLDISAASTCPPPMKKKQHDFCTACPEREHESILVAPASRPAAGAAERPQYSVYACSSPFALTRTSPASPTVHHQCCACGAQWPRDTRERHVSEAFACYAGGRNHTAAARRKAVPLAACGKFCHRRDAARLKSRPTLRGLPAAPGLHRQVATTTGAAGIPRPRLASLVLDGITDRSVSVPLAAAAVQPRQGAQLQPNGAGQGHWLAHRRQHPADCSRRSPAWPATASTRLAWWLWASDGSSLPSNRMTVMTMDSRAWQLPAPLGTSAQPDMPVCCVHCLGVSQPCAVMVPWVSHLCCDGALGCRLTAAASCASPSAFNAAALSAGLPERLPLLAQSAGLPGGRPRNNTACCRAKGVPDSCLPVCVARPGDPPPPAHCFDILRLSGPPAPGRLRQGCHRCRFDQTGGESYGTNFVDRLPGSCPSGGPSTSATSWGGRRPARAAPSRLVVLSQFLADVTVGTWSALQPGGHYSFRLAAVSDSGSSVLSDAVTVWLLPDLPSNWSASVNILPACAYGEGHLQCCQARKVPSHCQLLCDPRNMTNFNHTDSSLSVVYNNCTDSLPDITFCLADGKNTSPAAAGENVPDVCLGLCSAPPCRPAASPARCGGASGESDFNEQPIYLRLHRGGDHQRGAGARSFTESRDVFSQPPDRHLRPRHAGQPHILYMYIRFADTPSHWYAFLNPSNPAVFPSGRPTASPCSLLILNTNGFEPAQPGAHRGAPTTTRSACTSTPTPKPSSFVVLESSRPLILNCYYWWPLVATPTYRWFRSGHLLQSGSSSSYTIPHAEARDSGLYTSRGQSGSVSASLHIQSAVTAASLTGLVPVRLGSAARLSCAFEGFPDAWNGAKQRRAGGANPRRLGAGSRISDLLTYSSVEFSPCRPASSATTPAPASTHWAATPPAPCSTTRPTPPRAAHRGPRANQQWRRHDRERIRQRRSAAPIVASELPASASVAPASPIRSAPTVPTPFAGHTPATALADSRNFSRCCQRKPRGAARCLPLCWGDPPAPADVASCTAAGGLHGGRLPASDRRPRPAAHRPPPSRRRRTACWLPGNRQRAIPESSVSGYRILMRGGGGQPRQAHPRPLVAGRTQPLQTPVPTSAAISVTVVAHRRRQRRTASPPCPPRGHAGTGPGCLKMCTWLAPGTTFAKIRPPWWSSSTTP
uniref:Ig-like domain-containing protein n=1 Tax=Macrostomum lignano TaxID=282301 RepID=A0A1I8JPZ9_9PLAT